ncbi:hypothetical protein GGU10DRAFT_358267 [Lentinula aff. detonsa]|uniref:DUF6534 domain-containing protein n=1 Tax=Lentinula aff. detonsa TaxID=2804958 RepID=A0AA38KPC9_9AGAR|nr:hypothetical protein GGU10DRAFT_358267 [Lentinula aff. detonsa]
MPTFQLTFLKSSNIFTFLGRSIIARHWSSPQKAIPLLGIPLASVLSFTKLIRLFTMADVAPVFHVELMFGPMLIGVFFNMILFGVLLNQMHFYFQTYKSDALWIKCLVAYLFVVETANTVFDMIIIYQPLITQFGTQKAVKYFPTLFMTEPIVVVLVSMPIQCFFAWRITKITKSYIIPAIIVVLAFTSATGGFITGIKIVILKLFIKKPELHWSALLWFLPSCVADILITVTLVRSLSKRKTSFSVTNSMIDKLIRMTVQTGMITAICAIGDVACFMALPHTAINFIWDLALAKLYTNCLMSTLNARSALVNNGQTSNSGMFINVVDSTNQKDIRRQTFSGARFAKNMHELTNGSDIYELDSAKTVEAAQAQDSPYKLAEEV